LRTHIVFSPKDAEPTYRREPQSFTARTHSSSTEHSPDQSESSYSSIEGSNNWVISGEHTFSGAPILASDPHRAIHVPSLRHWVHLTAPGWDVIGAGEPALPGVALGHNRKAAWGFTIFAIDQEDLYVYETDPNDISRYRYRGGWESMKAVKETIHVKGRRDAVAELKYARHGPVLFEDPDNHRAYALRAAWLAEGAAPYLASLRIDQAESWDEFREACRHFLTPSENMVWADVDGHIGWQAVGLAPIRRNWNGLLPVPGDGRYEWEAAFLAADRLPSLFDPPSGRIATANQDDLPPGYPYAIGYEWADSFRYSRINEVLHSGERFALADMMRLQQDQLSLPARSLVPMLLATGPFGGRAREAADRLRTWDFRLDQGSIAAAIYVAWERAVRTLVWQRSVPAAAQGFFPVGSLSVEKVIEWMMSPDGRFGADPIAGRNHLLHQALDVAMTDLQRRFGPDLKRWRYGDVAFKHIAISHPLSNAVNLDWRARLNVGPLPRGGSAHTVNSTSDSDNQTAGASFRIVADLSDWDRTVGTNTPGQSGDPESDHYRDLFEPWASGKYFPVYYSLAMVKQATKSVILLVPPSDQ
jgi:penicillin amidase